MMKKSTILYLCVVALFILTGCSTVPITGRRQLAIVPNQEILSISHTQYDQLLSESSLSKDVRANQLVTKVGQRIADAAETFLKENGMADDIKNYTWEFNVIDDTQTVNAACLPGGKIVVYTGILPITKNETGLAVVMGHEVAHALAHHGAERVSQQLVVEFGGKKLAEAMSQKPEKTRDMVLKGFGIGSSLGVLLPYSRLHENEADRIGLILMAKAGYDPREAVSFWERMAKLGGEIPQFLSTHPATTKRIETIKSLLPEALQHVNRQ